uniref:Uncharacterized protein n=1 Tax=Anguilla anguilla TaxID=7936 RepID=A0A0E9WRJ4_ANGAN
MLILSYLGDQVPLCLWEPYYMHSCCGEHKSKNKVTAERCM